MLLLLRSSSYKINNSSPFGLCIVNADDTEKLFEKAFKYQPDYFPKGMAIDILKNENQPDLPWTFRLPFKGQKKYENEPIKHESGLSTLTKAIFEYKLSDGNEFLDNFKNEDNLQFIQTSRNWLNLVFDNHRQGKNKL
ncbi:MAG: hypothetical protein R2822_19285 [Spirosomataceae bacterium]